MTNPIIKLHQVSFSYPGSAAEALRGISAEFYPGEFVAVIGTNGSGKSTLAKHLNALLVPTGGTVLIDGMDTADEKQLIPIRRTVGMVFQNPDNQIVANVVEDDVAFAPENLGLPPAEIRRRVDEALRAVGMEDHALHSSHLLSGGQKQRVAIAGILAMRPRVIVLDEPTAMLDPGGRRDVMDILARLAAEGITVILITHHMEEAALAHRVLLMDGGLIAADDTPAHLFRRPDYLRELGLAVPDTIRVAELLRRGGLSIDYTLREDDCAAAVKEALCL